MKLKKELLLVLTVIFGLSGCTSQDVGMVTGGTLGAVVGSHIGHGTGNIVATSVGTLLGAVIGGRIGQRVDNYDRSRIYDTLESTKTNRHRTWHNSRTGARYDIEPTETFYRESADGVRPCRRFVTTVKIDGRRERVKGVACRTEDGNWEVVR